MSRPLAPVHLLVIPRAARRVAGRGGGAETPRPRPARSRSSPRPPAPPAWRRPATESSRTRVPTPARRSCTCTGTSSAGHAWEAWYERCCGGRSCTRGGVMRELGAIEQHIKDDATAALKAGDKRRREALQLVRRGAQEGAHRQPQAAYGGGRAHRAQARAQAARRGDRAVRRGRPHGPRRPGALRGGAPQGLHAGGARATPSSRRWWTRASPPRTPSRPRTWAR